MASPNQPGVPPLFKAGQKILCFHGPNIYGAKCLKVQNKEEKGKPVIKFRVHYDGWNKNWDEWVTSSRILERTEKNLKFSKENNAKVAAEVAAKKQLFKKLTQPQRSPAPKKVEPSPKGELTINNKKSPEAQTQKIAAVANKTNTTTTNTTTATSASDGLLNKSNQKRRKIDYKEETLAQPTQLTATTSTPVPVQPDPTINLPYTLEYQLWQDWSLVNQDKKLVPLPRAKTANIKSLLENFVTQHSQSTKIVTETACGIEAIFNAALGPQLLYHVERVQFAELVHTHPDTPLSELYGAEHLLRLIAGLPEQLKLEASSQNTNQIKGINMLVSFMESNRTTYLNAGYEMAAPPYLRRLAVFGKG